MDGRAFRALNELVVEKRSSGHTVRLLVCIGGSAFTSYAADGLIVATPTGSTAYSLSARGPIVSPTHRALLLTPVSPHMLFDRSLVLNPDEEIGIEVIGGRDAEVSVDGRHAAVLDRGRRRDLSRRHRGRPLRALRRAALPPDPQGQVRVDRPLMLTELRIHDLGVIAELSLVLGPGMTALTGETGAGKTMLVEAIDLLVGGRADATLVRPGAAEAVVEGRFVHDGEELVLARVVPADGRSRAYVDGRLATAASLAELGARLVDLHGQHAHQSLLATATQRASLDHFAAIDLAPLAGARRRVAELEAALAALGGDARARAREIDLLRFQVDEIAKAQLDGPDEDAELEKEALVLSDASAHREAAGEGRRGPDRRRRRARWRPQRAGRGAGARGLRRGRRPVARARRGARRRGRRAAGAGRGHRGRSGATGMDRRPAGPAPRAAPQVRRLARGGAWRSTREAEERLGELEGYEGRAAALEGERAEALAAVDTEAERVGEARRAAAPRLARAVGDHLRQLAMPRARLEVEVGGGPPWRRGDVPARRQPR